MSKRTSYASSSSDSSSSGPSKRHAGHREGYCVSLALDYPFLLPVQDRDSEEGGQVVECCVLCAGSTKRTNEIMLELGLLNPVHASGET